MPRRKKHRIVVEDLIGVRAELRAEAEDIAAWDAVGRRLIKLDHEMFVKHAASAHAVAANLYRGSEEPESVYEQRLELIHPSASRPRN